MKQLTCELCGSNEIVKQDGYYVCQYCGTKYSAEEAKKMIIEGTVDVSGSTVKIDESSEIKNLFELARRADSYEKKQKYYEKILEKDPFSWEAYFYSVYYDARADSESMCMLKIIKCRKKVLELIKDYVTDSSERKKAVKEVSKSLNLITMGVGIPIGTNIDISIKVTTREHAGDIMYYSGNDIIALFGDEYSSISVDCWKNAIEIYSSLFKMYSKKGLTEKSFNTISENLQQAASNIRKYEPTYQEPTYQAPAISHSSSSSGGCYVATAVYGSYDCPQVWTLRRYRDYTLAKTWYGRAFIRTYYAISPTLVKWFGKTNWFKKMWKPKLDRMVENLRAEGVEDSPYEDRNW